VKQLKNSNNYWKGWHSCL